MSPSIVQILILNPLYRVGYFLLDRNLLPDFLLRIGIRSLCEQRKKQIEDRPLDGERLFRQGLEGMPICICTEDANEQHYEVPARFYQLCLGNRLKYSGCFFETPSTTLDEAEETMLSLCSHRARGKAINEAKMLQLIHSRSNRLEDGQDVLDLGCGWGSFGLYIAERYPNSSVTCLSNSKSQAEYIMSQCAAKGITNLKTVTMNVLHLELTEQFDRIVTVEMFEHMKNYAKLLEVLSGLLRPDGYLFVHIFSHVRNSYHFEAADDTDWMAKYFFTGGTMPSDNLLLHYGHHLSVIDHWQINGNHYHRTCEEWLKNMDNNSFEVRKEFEVAYGKGKSTQWIGRWRAFFIACSELFRFNKGKEWIVSHYLFENRVSQQSPRDE